MADLKPLGSEKLNADDKLKRILELTYFNEKNKKSNTSKPELVKESKSGVYGIVKEKDGYYVKRGINESSLDYIGGMFMKNKNRFSSYGEALKRLNLIQGQEELQEATKYVLKQNKPQTEAPAPVATDEPSAPAPEPTGALDVPSAEEQPALPPAEPTDNGGDMSGEEGGEPKRSDYMEEIQKFAGKLGQELRDQHEKLESDDIKYVLNMIISAVNLDKLSDEDIEDIGKKFDREDKEQGGELDTMSDEEPSAETTPDSDIAEEAPMDALEAFINTPLQDEIDLSSYASGERGDKPTDENHDLSKHADLEMGEDEEKELDLDEIKNSISQAVGETLSKYFN
jgi:hypothetical protein